VKTLGGGVVRVGMFVMKLISWNVQGLGSVEKRREVRKLVEEKKPLILCLQETKLAVCNDKLNLLMWGDSNHAYSFRPSVGASGGLLTVWDTLEVEVWSSVSQENVLLIHGKFIRTNEVFYIFNVYAPCEVRARQQLWVRCQLNYSCYRVIRCVYVGILMPSVGRRKEDL